MTWMWGRGVDVMSDDDLYVRSWRGCHVGWWHGCEVVSWMPRNATWNPCHLGLPRLLNMFTAYLYDYTIQVPTSRPQRLFVRYKSSVTTQIRLVIVVLNDSNTCHKQSHFCRFCCSARTYTLAYSVDHWPGSFRHIESVKILVILNPTSYMLTSSGFSRIHLGYIL